MAVAPRAAHLPRHWRSALRLLKGSGVAVAPRAAQSGTAISPRHEAQMQRKQGRARRELPRPCRTVR